MKKVIESELISIAHRILKINEKTDVKTLLLLAQEVQNKLAVLQFYENHQYQLDPSLTTEKITSLLVEKTTISAPLPSSEADESHAADSLLVLEKENQKVEDTSALVSTDQQEELIEAAPEMEQALTGEKAQEIDPFEDPFVAKEEVATAEAVTDSHAAIQDFAEEELSASDEKQMDEIPNVASQPEAVTAAHLATDETSEAQTEQLAEPEEKKAENTDLHIDPVFQLSYDKIEFEKAVPTTPSSVVSSESTASSSQSTSTASTLENQHFLSSLSENKQEIPFHQIPLNKTINDAFSNMITIGLNDRIAFEKHLFNHSSEDLNRVISQLNTIETLQEAQDFIEDLVKPDFNYWAGKEEYVQRFMHMIEKRFK